MSAPRDFSRASWRLKIERAKKHLVELEDQVRVYSERHPYRIGWERHGNPDSGEWLCILRITEQPDRAVSTIIGDVVHNVRSALDHLATAIAPESQEREASFPIRDVDPWNLDGRAGEKARESFQAATRGMPEEAKTIIKQLQPYSRWPPNHTALLFHLGGAIVVGESRTPAKFFFHSPQNHFLSVLNEFDNRDKHRTFVPIVTSLPGGIVTIRDRSGIVIHTEDVAGPRKDGAPILEVSEIPTPTGIRLINPESKVDMQIRGSIQVTVRVGEPEGVADIVQTLRGFTDRLPSVVFPALEPWVRPSWAPHP